MTAAKGKRRSWNMGASFDRDRDDDTRPDTGMKQSHIALTSHQSDEWYTPPEVLEPVIRVLGTIDLDPASPRRDGPVPAAQHFTREDNGLSLPWHGRVYLNPPFSRVYAWVGKLREEYDAGRVTEAILLCSVAPDTVWWSRLSPDLWCAWRGRIRFVGAPNGTTRPSALVYLGEHRHRFAQVFARYGTVYERRYRCDICPGPCVTDSTVCGNYPCPGGGPD